MTTATTPVAATMQRQPAQEGPISDAGRQVSLRGTCPDCGSALTSSMTYGPEGYLITWRCSSLVCGWWKVI